VNVVGFDRELERVRRSVESDGRRALLIEGDIGAGKTTLWETGIARAR
jgi:tRNA A37 threonylcarbamoyladenosine biosynthesis protein TsaE